ncbi:High-affinity branched-chain amino acid transport ATP-binding protein LivF [Pigmentiphaga humi]|uniref:High-affinity branched-chain amino acid transport ATP-binding protein LivF n=1 Tax=Pigmentiphaga humi TaxID=2478468 RepID=A0A3P4B6S6_9BURK|nr:ABC transporter ATP-binding protein [Pigmentiphaga humi]VCU72004.1 High-affinity branched-chain amino acid transport ATP-binding protein LivF [Pigmentiphaga humi]
MGDMALRIADARAWYGKAQVLHGARLEVGRGEIVALLGRNGAGRSTLARTVMGLVARSGSFVWNGRETRTLRPFDIARLGIGYVPESRDIFPGMTVAQNLLLGQKQARPGRWRPQDAYDLFPALGRRADTDAQVLSGGEQQMLALARTLMGDPALMLVDEPTEGLAPQVVAQLRGFFQVLREQGMAMLLIEQKLDLALDIADRVYVLGHGAVVFEGTPAALLAQPGVRKEWLEL